MKYTRAIALLTSTLFAVNFGSQPAQAQSEAAACKDIPSCVVESFVIIGGVGYWIIKNTATGLTRRVPAKRVAPPTHSNHQSGDYSLPGSRKEKRGFVFSPEECEEFAKEQERLHGGKWKPITERVTIGTPEGDMVTRPAYICAAEREE